MKSHGITQNKQILEYLKTHEYITPMDAMNYFGIMRLAARISDLTRQGYVFERKTIKSHNRFGDDVQYRGYKLIHEAIENN